MVGRPLLYLLAPMFLAIIAGTNSHTSMPAGIVLLLISAIFSVVAGWKLRSTLNEYRRCRLGFSGERAVGHHLNQLAAGGYRIYHDLQFGGFNIDHVLIGPSGVYAVETKTFKKGKGKTSHMVDYDGKNSSARNGRMRGRLNKRYAMPSTSRSGLDKVLGSLSGSFLS